MTIPDPFRLLLVTQPGADETDDQIRALIRERVDRLSSDDETVVRSYTDTMGLNVAPFHLAVVQRDLATMPGLPSPPGNYLGLQFVLGTVGTAAAERTAFILVTPSIDRTVVDKTSAIGRCLAVQYGMDFEQDFLEAFDQLFPPAQPETALPPPPPRPSADVEIRLLPGMPSYRISVRSPSQNYCLSGVLSLGDGIQAALARLHRDVPTCEYPRWMRALEEIGQTLFQKLCASPGFWPNLRTARDVVGGVGNMRIRFVVDDQLFPLAWESLHVPPDPPADVPARELFWMLQAPVFRNLYPISDAYPDFAHWHGSDSRIRTLIIDADVTGYVAGVGYLPRLKNVRRERRTIERLIRVHTRRAGGPEFAPPVVVSRETLPQGTTFRDQLRKTLESEPVWHVVHFGGHTYFDEDSRQGYAILPGGEPPADAFDVVPLEDLGLWLGNACMLYLGSCRESEDNAVLTLAHQRIPAVVGFRWDLDDDKAAKHARAFYKDLIHGSGLIEEAFLTARKELHARYETNRIWAAPMLVLQGGDRLEHLFAQSRQQGQPQAQAAE